MFKKVLLTGLVLALLSPLPAMASFYVGAAIGNSWYSDDVTVDDVGNEIKNISETSTGWKAFGGFKSESFFGLEGGYRDLGEVESKIDGVTYGGKTSGWDVEATGRVKISIIDLFAKAGAFFWESDGVFLDDSGTAFLWGLGAGVRLGPIGVRLEWEAMEVKQPDSLSMLSLGATLGF